MGECVPGGTQVGHLGAKHIFPCAQCVIAALLPPDDQGHFLLSSWWLHSCLLDLSQMEPKGLRLQL